MVSRFVDNNVVKANASCQNTPTSVILKLDKNDDNGQVPLANDTVDTRCRSIW